MRKRVFEFDAIGTHWWCELLDEGDHFTSLLTQEILTICDEFDQRYSRFRDDSLIMELFNTGMIHNPPAEMVEMFRFADEMYTVSHGAFDVTVGATLHHLGYGDRTKGQANDPRWSSVSYTPDTITAPQGVMIDFGGFGKGWLIDRLVACLRQHGKRAFIVNGGGDLFVSSNSPVDLALEDPHDSTKQYGQTRITNGALAASSTVKRSWMHEGQRYHHIINPQYHTSSTSGVVGTFVKADTALIADTMATILVIRPDLEQALKLRYNLETIIVR